MDIFGHFEIGDMVDLGPAYEHRADMRGNIMVQVDPRAQNGRAVFIKDYKVIRILDLTDPGTLGVTQSMLGEFDAMLINPASVPEHLLDRAEAETKERNRKELS